MADAEDEPGDLIVEIESDVDGAWDVTVHSDGTLSGSQFLSEAEHRISVSATDTLGGTATETPSAHPGAADPTRHSRVGGQIKS